MFHAQHKYLGDRLLVDGDSLLIPGKPSARGQIVFEREEYIGRSGHQIFDELKKYNKKLAEKGIAYFNLLVEDDRLKAQVRRTFGDVNGWAGDHGDLKPNYPDDKFKVQLQGIDNRKDLTYISNALSNWDHFTPLSYATWKKFHNLALRLAKEFAQDSGSGQGYKLDAANEAVVFDLDKSRLALALFFEAYGCHFLQDCFVSGHLRTPRLLFGNTPLALRAMSMHGEDNEAYLVGTNEKNESFELVGEDHKKDYFKEKGENNNLIERIILETSKAMKLAVQQVLNQAFPDKATKPVTIAQIRDLIPRIEVRWEKIPNNGNKYSHELVIEPLVKPKTKPKYVFRAKFDSAKGRFENRLKLMKREKNGQYKKREVIIGASFFTPGKKKAWWIPDHVDKVLVLPA